MSIHDDPGPNPAAAPEPGFDRQAAYCLGDKLAHRALRVSPRPTLPALSPQARDRLYDRMFPRDICQGAKDHENSDTLA